MKNFNFVVDFPKSPWLSINKKSKLNSPSDEEEDKSMFQVQLLSNCQDVHLIKGIFLKPFKNILHLFK